MIISVAEHTFLAEGAEIYSFKRYLPFEKPEINDELLFKLTLNNDLPNPVSTPIGDFDDNNGRTLVYRSDNSWTIECIYPSTENPYSRLVCLSDFSEAQLQIIDTKYADLAMDNALMMLYAFASAKHNTLLLHSSVVVYEGKGYLFLGKSGTGKSTHSRLWLENIEGTHLLNDDNPILRIKDGQATVYGSPWSGKTPCYKNEEYPVGGIVRLWQKPENAIRKLRPAEALAALKPTASVLPCSPETERQVLETLSLAVETIPIYSLGCLPDADAALLCRNTIAG